MQQAQLAQLQPMPRFQKHREKQMNHTVNICKQLDNEKLMRWEQQNKKKWIITAISKPTQAHWCSFVNPPPTIGWDTLVIDLRCCVQLLYRYKVIFWKRKTNLSLPVWLNNLKMDFRFPNDRVMCIAGPSQSGNAHFVLKLLDQRNEKFIKPLKKVRWCYGIHGPILHRLLQGKGYHLQHGFPTEKDMEPNSVCVMIC